MSAPHEVFCGTDGRTEEFSFDVAPFNVRYLRADLTCGECRLDIDTTPACPFSAEEYNLPRKENPACMAIIPKEEER